MGHCRCRKSQVARRKDAKYCRHKPPSPAPAPSKLPPNSLQMEMAKYQGWRGVPRAISEERWKKECSRRTGGARGWLQLQLQVPEKNKEKVERYPERRSSQTRVATTCLADKTNHPVERLSLNRSQC